jgi:hypothetical protein
MIEPMQDDISSRSDVLDMLLYDDETRQVVMALKCRFVRKMYEYV